MATLADFRSAERPTWCPACGDFAVLAALQRAAVALHLEPEQMVVASGIGCSGKLPQHFGAYGYHSLHGRSIPTAVGIKLGNRDLTVVAAGGDGDGYGIGLSHFLHAVRRNIDITYIVMDNHIYGLTTGQASPTSAKGMQTKTTPYGAAEWPIRPVALALVQGCGFVAQGFSGDAKHLADILQRAIAHKGFSLVNVFSPCVTFNKLDTYDFYRQHLHNLDKDESYDRRDRLAAIKAIQENENVYGVLFEEERPTYEDELSGFAREGLATRDNRVSRELFDDMLANFA